MSVDIGGENVHCIDLFCISVLWTETQEIQAKVCCGCGTYSMSTFLAGLKMGIDTTYLVPDSLNLKKN
jgi:hypothetical protein